MNMINAIVELMKNLLTWWFIVEPWEQAVLIKFGKHFKLIHPGTHFKIPFLYIVYKQNIRRRTSGIPIQTLTTADGKIVTVNGSIGYSITDVMMLHQTLHDAEMTVKQEVQGIVAEYVANHQLENCKPQLIVAAVKEKLALERYGLSSVEFFLTGYVVNVRTLRLLSDPIQYAYSYGEGLNTAAAHSK